MNDFEFGNFIYERRCRIGITQSEMAERLGVTNKAVSKWETGKSKPTTNTLRKMAALFGISVEELLKQTIVVREKGSGTRRIFEERLAAMGYELSDFYREVSISSFVVIKALVAAGIGISFMYQSVISKENGIGTFAVDGITEPHPFHVVYTRNTSARNYAEQFLKFG